MHSVLFSLVQSFDPSWHLFWARATLAPAARHTIPAEHGAWSWAQGWPCFHRVGCSQRGMGSFVPDTEKGKNSLLLFQIKNPAPFFFLHSSPANEALWPRCWFYPLTTHKSRNNAQVLVCDSESQKTVASSLFLTSIFTCSRPHPQEWKQHQLKFKWCKHEWLCVKNRNLLRFLSMPFQSAK